MKEIDLVAILKPGDEITTTLKRVFVVGAVHADEKWAGQFWIEPKGGDDYDWWIPVSNVVRVNGKDVQVVRPTDVQNPQDNVPTMEEPDASAQ
jgi:hypothetical protein